MCINQNFPFFQAGQAGVSEVNPEFLAALPPSIQEEVNDFTETVYPL